MAQFARGMCLHDDDLAADFLCFVFSVSFPVLLQLCSSVPFAFRRVFFCFIQPPVVYKKCKRIYIDLIRMRTGERAGDRADLGGGKERERERKSEGRDSLRLAVSRSRSKKNSVLSLSLSPLFSPFFFSQTRASRVFLQKSNAQQKTMGAYKVRLRSSQSRRVCEQAARWWPPRGEGAMAALALSF